MSTMLKTAAMSLLSKTLQTFLYKYLLDVDVEGVAMPSFMDADGQSGWGVRLVNVRLREGVELMTLPGKRKVKRPKPKEDSPKEKGGEETDERVKVPLTNGGGANLSVVSSSVEAPKRATKPEDAGTEDENIEVSERQTLLSQDYYASDDEDGVVSNAAPSRVLSCFSRGGKSAVGPTTPTKSNTKVHDDGKQKRAIRDNIGTSFTEPEKPSLVQQPKECDEEDEHIEVEQDMVLRLGTGGRVGVLDVRLVGKELHVSVEDAFLVVEVCQKPDELEKMTDAEKTTEAGKSEEQKGKDAAAADKKKPAASKKAARDMTVGERVLEKSAIARALSAVPHLFLRDVCVRVIVRDGHVTSEAEEEISETDSVVDIGIELLSVTSGEDFLAHVRAELDDPRPRYTEEQKHQSMSSFASFDETSDNEFILKRIRTGRGPEGGIWLKVFPPGRIRTNKQVSDNVDDGAVRWARERWVAASRFCLFRCSGLDVVSRIYVGKQEAESNDYFFYDEFIVDSMLVGVDYTAAGPAPSLPPLEQNGDGAELEAMQAMREANRYVTDGNGIQSVSLKSVFHKVARGLQPTVCRSGHLPCETCSECWTVDGASAQKEHPLDASTPLAGVVFNLSLNDPLEVNADRASLEVVGQLQSLFTKKSTVSKSETLAEEPEAEVELNSSIHGGGVCMPSQRLKSSPAENVTDSFPSYMEPENIEIMGLHFAKMVFRIHVMRSDGIYDRGLSFCYWEAQTRCITLDMQTLSSQKQLKDVRFDIGEFTTVEFKGTGNNRLISLGLPHPEVYSSDSSSSSQPPKSSSRPPWPSTAYSLLGISVPMETIHYESRERHALQIRYTALSGSNTDEDRSVVDVRVGVASVDMPFKTKDDIYAVISESQKSVFGPPEDEKPKEVDTPTNGQKPKAIKQEVSTKSSLLRCKVRVDGGRVNVSPVINLCLPPSTFFVENSSLRGLFFETMLQRMDFAYGERAIHAKSCRGNLSRLAALPEGIRLRVLLFVNDLGPLETALGLKHESNSFRRYRGVNKAIVRVAKRSSKLKRKKRESHIVADRREEMLAELLSMDDTELQDLWSLHQGSKDALKSKLSRHQSA